MKHHDPSDWSDDDGPGRLGSLLITGAVWLAAALFCLLPFRRK